MSHGISDEESWLANAKVPCGLCGPHADHWWSRCVKIWASTAKGQTMLGQANAARQVARLHSPQTADHINLVREFPGMVFQIMLLEQQPGDIPHLDRARDVVSELMDRCDVQDEYDSAAFFHDVECMVEEYHARALRAGQPSSA